jgi:predicted AlkP superfamily phosphohydrolase/phosphomutase
MKKKKLFFFGIDSATWDLILPWVKGGKLPGFKKLIEEGYTKTLYSTIPQITPVAWPTALTGVTPAQHGFYDFYKLDKNKEITVNLASEINYPFFWEILSANKKRVALFNLPITYPIRPVNGEFISGLMTPGLDADFAYPSKLKTEFKKRFSKFRFGPEIKVSKGDPESYKLKFGENIADANETIEIAKWLFKRGKWDMFGVNFMAVDHIQHFFWEFMKDKNSEFNDAILKIYQIVDKYLLEVIEKYSSEYQILVFSDHGAGELKQTMFLNKWLLDNGYLYFRNSIGVYAKRILSLLGINPKDLINLASRLGIVRKAGKINMQRRNRLMNKLILSYSDLDWKKTVAYSFGMYGGIYLNKENNRVKEKENELKSKIIKAMKKDFRKLITFIDTSENIYKTKKIPKTIPDIQFLMENGAVVSTNIYAFSGKKLFTKPITHKSGEHRMEGIIGFYPKPKSVYKVEKVEMVDLTPTILAYFGIDKADYMTGKSILINNRAEEEKSVVEEIEI